MKRALVALFLSWTLICLPAASAQQHIERDLRPATALSYVELLVVAGEVNATQFEVDAAEKLFRTEADIRKEAAKKAQRGAGEEVKNLQKELGKLNVAASIDTAELSAKRAALHCKIRDARRNEVAYGLAAHMIEVELDNDMAKLDLLAHWPADSKRIAAAVAAGEGRKRKYGDFEDLGLRKGFKDQYKDISLGRDAIADARRMGLVPPEVDVEAQRRHDRVTAGLQEAHVKAAADLKEYNAGRGDPDKMLRDAEAIERFEARLVVAKKQLALATDVTEYVRKLAQFVGRNSDLQVPLSIYLLWDDDPNAFALPGGFLFINTGLLYGIDEDLYKRSGVKRGFGADDEAEVAGVLAHEIAHVTARHGHRLMKRANLMNLAMNAAWLTIMIAFPPATYGAMLLYEYGLSGIGLLFGLNLLGVSRDFEREADQLGIQYMTRAGYDSTGFVRMFDKMATQYGYAHNTSFWRTHPAFYERIHDTYAERSYLPKQADPVVSTENFERAIMELRELRTMRLERLKDEGMNAPMLGDQEPECGVATLVACK